MKKLLKGLLLLTIAVAMIGCKASTDDGSGGYYDPTDISFDGKTFKLTGSVQLMQTAKTVTGSADLNLNSGFIEFGAFPNGRSVTLSPFIMGKYEVTQELYEAVMTGKTEGGYALTAKPSICVATETSYKLLDGETQKYRPVESVTWYDAVYFCNALSEKEGLTNAYTITNITVSSGHITSADVSFDKTKNGYRLPTEAEWEYAARGGAAGVTNGTFANYWSGATTTNYSSSENEDLDSAGWYWYNISSGTTSSTDPSSGAAGYGTHQVGKKPKSNAAGLCDMSGNVWEWCYDWYDDDVTINDNAFKVDGNVTDPSGPSEPLTDLSDPSEDQPSRVLRGGSWGDDAYFCAVSLRSSGGLGLRHGGLGFRVVRSAE